MRINKKQQIDLIFIFLLLESTYVILHSLSRIQSQKEFKDAYLTTLEIMKQQGNDQGINKSTQYFITDLVFIDRQTDCPSLYEQLLPYVLCKSLKDKEDQSSNQPLLKTWIERCYQSASDVEYLSFKTKDNIENNTTYFKICGKPIGPSDYRMDAKNYNQNELYSKVCAYQDTFIRGYISQSNDCSINSSEQICESDQYLFKSQFMIACLENNSTEGQTKSSLTTVFTCEDNEIACMFSNRFYCIKNSEKCPIVDIKISPEKLTELEEQGYESSRIQEIYGYSYIRRNDLFMDVIIGLEILEDSSVGRNTIKYIEVESEGSMKKKNNNSNGQVYHKSICITHEEINQFKQVTLEGIQSSLENRVLFFKIIFILCIVIDISIFLNLLKFIFEDQRNEFNRNLTKVLQDKLFMLICYGGLVLLCYSIVSLYNYVFYDNSKGQYTKIKINDLDYDILSWYWSDVLILLQILPHWYFDLNPTYVQLEN